MTYHLPVCWLLKHGPLPERDGHGFESQRSEELLCQAEHGYRIIALATHGIGNVDGGAAFVRDRKVEDVGPGLCPHVACGENVVRCREG